MAVGVAYPHIVANLAVGDGVHFIGSADGFAFHSDYPFPGLGIVKKKLFGIVQAVSLANGEAGMACRI